MDVLLAMGFPYVFAHKPLIAEKAEFVKPQSLSCAAL
jgi:hypothetical protein